MEHLHCETVIWTTLSNSQFAHDMLRWSSITDISGRGCNFIVILYALFSKSSTLFNKTVSMQASYMSIDGTE